MRLNGLAHTSVTTASFGEAVRIAFDSLRASKLRSFLTLLGIILATTTLIAVMSRDPRHGRLYRRKRLRHGRRRISHRAHGVHRATGIRRNFSRCRERNPEIKPDEYRVHQGARQAGERESACRVSARRRECMTAEARWTASRFMGAPPNMGAINNFAARDRADSSPRARTSATCRWRSSAAISRSAFFPRARSGWQDDHDRGPAVPGDRRGQIAGQRFREFAGQLRHDSRSRRISRCTGRGNGMGYVGAGASTRHLLQAQDEVRCCCGPIGIWGPGEDDNFAHVRLGFAHVGFWEQLTGAIAATAMAMVSRLHGGGRRRDHEHHAGRGHRAHARDRHPQVRGRAQPGYSESVSGGIVVLAGMGGLIGVAIAW